MVSNILYDNISNNYWLNLIFSNLRFKKNIRAKKVNLTVKQTNTKYCEFNSTGYIQVMHKWKNCSDQKIITKLFDNLKIYSIFVELIFKT